MRRALLFFLCFLLVACGHGRFKIPKEAYRQRVKTLGVLPLLLDEGSAVRHPEREELLALLRRHNAGKSERLVALLREGKGYFDIRSISGDPRSLFDSLVSGGTAVGQADRRYRSYRFRSEAVAELAAREVVDALLIVVMYGVERHERRWDRVPTTYLEADYNSIVVTAAVVSPTGELLWEFPGMSDGPFLPLQYPDFDEAYYNRSDAVRIRYISLAGLERVLTEKERGLLARSDFPRRYRELFGEIVSALDPGLLNPFPAREGGGAERKGAEGKNASGAN